MKKRGIFSGCISNLQQKPQMKHIAGSNNRELIHLTKETFFFASN